MGENLLSGLMHPEDFEIYTHDIYPRYWIINDDQQVYNEYRMRNKKGDWCWLNSHEIIFTRKEDGSPWQILGISSDITKRKKTEEYLVLSETRYRYFVEQTGEGFYRNDSEEPIDIHLPVKEQVQLMYQRVEYAAFGILKRFIFSLQLILFNVNIIIFSTICQMPYVFCCAVLFYRIIRPCSNSIFLNKIFI